MIVTLISTAVAMLQNSLASILAIRAPALALSIDPGNADAQSRRAQQLQSDLTATSQDEVAQLARDALARSPVSATAAGLLAITRETDGDHPGAMRLIRYAESMSRRDFLTEALLIQQALGRNDIPSALHHYDIALRTTEASRPVLFPILISAIEHPEVISGLGRIFADRPPWGDLFLLTASRQSADLDQLAKLLIAIHEVHYSIPETAIVVAIDRMVDLHRYRLAQSIYSSVYPGKIGPVRDELFAATGLRHTAFDWRLPEIDGVMTAPIEASGRGALSIHAVTGSGGVVARQLLMLPTGKYQLRARLTHTSGAGSAWVRFTCAKSNDLIAEFRPLAANGWLRGALISDPSCEAQWIEIVIDAGDEPSGFAGVIGRLSFIPLPPTASL